MKYLSLIEFMRVYGCYIKDHHRVTTIVYNAILTYDKHINYCPFDIEPANALDKKQLGLNTEQILNILQISSSTKIISHYNYSLSDFYMPPILEMEWLRTKLDFGDEKIDVLIQLSYMIIAYIMADHLNTYDYTETTWMENLEANHAIIEVEDLKDTMTILMQNPLTDINLPKIRSWHNILIYATDLQSILKACENQSNMFMHIYYHLPIILSMFMIDYFGNNLANWTASNKLAMEHKIQDNLYVFENYTVNTDKLYTYGRTRDITNKDLELVNTVFNVIYSKLHEINQDIGLISYNNYKQIRGPETSTASILLYGMNIDWNKEMEQKNKAANNPIDDLF